MGVRFTPVEEVRDELPIAIGLSGASGTGKTYTALRIARGIARERTRSDDPRVARFAVVDTENKRALHYASEFPEMLHFNMDLQGDGNGPDGLQGYHPDRFIEILQGAEKAQVQCLLIDSFTHATNGHNGLNHIKEQELDKMCGERANLREVLSLPAWAKAKPVFDRLKNRLIQSKVPVILCTRAKTIVKDRNGKLLTKNKSRVADSPYSPQTDEDLIFEMGVAIMLDPSSPGAPVWQMKVPDQLKGLFLKNRPMDEELGRELVRWSRGESRGIVEKRILDAARAAARQGTAALAAHWSGLPKSADGPDRVLVKGILENLQREAREVDSQDDDLPLDEAGERGPTPEEIARRTAEAQREVEERDRAQVEG